MVQAQLTGVFSTSFPKPWLPPWKQDVKVFIDHQRARECLEGFRSAQWSWLPTRSLEASQALLQPGAAEGSCGGRDQRGSSREAFPHLAIRPGCVAGARPGPGTGMCLLQSQEWEERSLPLLLRMGGLSYSSRLSFQQSDTRPHTCQGEDPRCLHGFMHSGHPGPAVTGPRHEPATQGTRQRPAHTELRLQQGDRQQEP